MRPARQLLLLYTAITALLLLGLFMVRAMNQAFYYDTLRYAEVIFALLSLMLGFYFRALKPNRARGDGSLNWYVARGLTMSLSATLLATLLISIYTYQVDEGFFLRRLDWERQLLEQQNIPSEVVDMFMEDEEKDQQLHLEEVSVFFLGGISSLVATLALASFFLGSNKRDLGPGVTFT